MLTQMYAQGTLSGKIADKQTTEPLGFVNVKVTRATDGKFVGGTMTDADGVFSVKGLANGKYTMQLTFVGYKDEKR